MYNMNNFKRDKAAAIHKNNVFFIILGWAAAILSLFMYPLVFGMVGVVSGILAVKSGGKAGIVLIAASILLMAAGLIFSGTLLNYTRHYLGV